MVNGNTVTVRLVASFQQHADILARDLKTIMQLHRDEYKTGPYSYKVISAAPDVVLHMQ